MLSRSGDVAEVRILAAHVPSVIDVLYGRVDQKNDLF